MQPPPRLGIAPAAQIAWEPIFSLFFRGILSYPFPAQKKCFSFFKNLLTISCLWCIICAVNSANGRSHLLYTEKYSRGRRGAPAKGVGRVNRRESSNLSFSANGKATRQGGFSIGKKRFERKRRLAGARGSKVSAAGGGISEAERVSKQGELQAAVPQFDYVCEVRSG